MKSIDCRVKNNLVILGLLIKKLKENLEVEAVNGL
jgi:hypothetical protein